VRLGGHTRQGRVPACSVGQRQVAEGPASWHAAYGVVGQADVAASLGWKGAEDGRDGQGGDFILDGEELGAGGL